MGLLCRYKTRRKCGLLLLQNNYKEKQRGSGENMVFNTMINWCLLFTFIMRRLMANQSTKMIAFCIFAEDKTASFSVFAGLQSHDDTKTMKCQWNVEPNIPQKREWLGKWNYFTVLRLWEIFQLDGWFVLSVLLAVFLSSFQSWHLAFGLKNKLGIISEGNSTAVWRCVEKSFYAIPVPENRVALLSFLPSFLRALA